MKVIDDFLPDYHFRSLSNILLGNDFSWFYNEDTAIEGDGYSHFINMFYKKYPVRDVSETLGPTKSFPKIEPYLPFFKMKELYRIKANLAPRTVFHKKTGWHVDNLPCSTTAILYMNTNNGWTEFKKGGKVKSVANRLVTFDSDLEHQGVTCTDKKRRVLINFNYDL